MDAKETNNDYNGMFPGSPAGDDFLKKRALIHPFNVAEVVGSFYIVKGLEILKIFTIRIDLMILYGNSVIHLTLILVVRCQEAEKELDCLFYGAPL